MNFSLRTLLLVIFFCTGVNAFGSVEPTRFSVLTSNDIIAAEMQKTETIVLEVPGINAETQKNSEKLKKSLKCRLCFTFMYRRRVHRALANLKQSVNKMVDVNDRLEKSSLRVLVAVYESPNDSAAERRLREQRITAFKEWQQHIFAKSAFIPLDLGMIQVKITQLRLKK